MTFRPAYAIVAIMLFVIEVLIAIFVRDRFIRPYVGDVLAVMLVYCALRAIAPIGTVTAIAATLAIAFAVEAAQLFNLLDLLGLRGDAIAETLLGGAFDVLDLAAYVAGALIVLAAETVIRRRATP